MQKMRRICSRESEENEERPFGAYLKEEEEDSKGRSRMFKARDNECNEEEGMN